MLRLHSQEEEDSPHFLHVLCIGYIKQSQINSSSWGPHSAAGASAATETKDHHRQNPKSGGGIKKRPGRHFHATLHQIIVITRTSHNTTQ